MLRGISTHYFNIYTMKQTKICAALLIMAASLTGCGLGSTQSATTGNGQADVISAGAGILGAILGGGTGNTATDVLTGVIGVLTAGNQSASIVGTWTYDEPSVEFQSENLLAQAGGAVAAKEVVSKLKPYYERIGITGGKMTITFNEDKTCLVNIGGQNQTANYAYDAKSHTLKVTGQNLGLSFGTIYATVGASQMSLTLDSSKLLTLAQTIGAASGNPTVTGLSQLAGSFNGMKTGFKFKRK